MLLDQRTNKKTNNVKETTSKTKNHNNKTNQHYTSVERSENTNYLNLKPQI